MASKKMTMREFVLEYMEQDRVITFFFVDKS